MDFALGTYGLGFLAGALTALSPCVLPLVPILVASALAAHRLGVIALALGLSVSFSAIGIFLATIGASLGLGDDVFRHAATVLMILFGLAMLSQQLQARLSHATSLLFIGLGLLVLFGLDKVLETAILSVSPAWLTAFTTTP